MLKTARDAREWPSWCLHRLTLVRQVRRAKRFISRYWRAHGLGVEFRGARRVKFPIVVGSTAVKGSPDDMATRVAFVEIFLDDEYGLARVHNMDRVLDIGANVGFFS